MNKVALVAYAFSVIGLIVTYNWVVGLLTSWGII